MPIYKRYKLQSEKNGTIVVQWLFGNPRVYAGGSQQSGPYVDGLWRDAVQRLPKNTEVKTILALGLGGACAWPMLDKQFPNAQVTVVEWDEVMVGLAKSFKRWKREPEIIVGDVCEVLPTLNRQFDLILDDAFYGYTPEVRVGDPACAEALASVLAPRGHCIVNVSETHSLIDALKHSLKCKDSWLYRENTVAMFTH